MAHIHLDCYFIKSHGVKNAKGAAGSGPRPALHCLKKSTKQKRCSGDSLTCDDTLPGNVFLHLFCPEWRALTYCVMRQMSAVRNQWPKENEAFSPHALLIGTSHVTCQRERWRDVDLFTDSIGAHCAVNQLVTKQQR